MFNFNNLCTGVSNICRRPGFESDLWSFTACRPPFRIYLCPIMNAKQCLASLGGEMFHGCM